MPETKTVNLTGVLIGVLAWFSLAVVLGAYGFLALFPPPFPQGVLFGLVITLLFLFWKYRPFHEWILRLDVRALVFIHLTRLVGIYFLVLYSRGQLPYAFAVPGGWGDITVAVTALLVAIFLSTDRKASRLVLFLWNLLGLLDILFVVATATRLALASPGSMIAITRLPLSLLPTFLVPIIIFSHIVIFVRLYKSRSGGAEPSHFSRVDGL
ncbi:MAG TPA: hypothetical protein VNN20_10335 [Thermodesulfobacteriota bacterium]|nr:hypothetical protein [Thermodesulfobacteriota bacterium]